VPPSLDRTAPSWLFILPWEKPALPEPTKAIKISRTKMLFGIPWRFIMPV
jgi:hypothetical protein